MKRVSKAELFESIKDQAAKYRLKLKELLAEMKRTMIKDAGKLSDKAPDMSTDLWELVNDIQLVDTYSLTEYMSALADIQKEKWVE